MVTPKFIISTDWHIKPSNIDQIKDIIAQQIKLAQELNITNHICLGDVFQSRQAQTIAVLSAFQDILEMFKKARHTLTAISGNHDKTDYSSDYSFLFPFKEHEAFTLIERYYWFEKDNFHFIPFYNDKEWREIFEQIKKKSGVLFSHIAVEGSVNNDGSKVESSIKPSIFEGFEKVFLGHYHDQHKVGDNIYHLPSIQANNFGENNQKGFTVLYSDNSHKLFKSVFKEFKTIAVDLNDLSKKDLENLKQKHAKDESYIRFKITGNESKLKSLTKAEFTEMGFGVVFKSEESDFEEMIEVKKFNKSSIAQEFKDWCKQEGLDYELGVKYLNKILQ